MRLLSTCGDCLAQMDFSVFFSLVILLATCALTGCANLQNKSTTTVTTQVNSDLQAVMKAKHQSQLAEIKGFTQDSRIGVQADGRGFSGKMHWRHLNAYNSIDLYSPLGSKMVAIESNSDGVTLTSSDGNTVNASDVESLTEQTMGWRLPAQHLEDWVLGRATDAPITNATWDEAGRFSKLTQNGWEVEYITYQDVEGYSLPSKLNLRNAKLYLKLIVERWQIHTSKESPEVKPY